MFDRTAKRILALLDAVVLILAVRRIGSQLKGRRLKLWR